MAAQSRKTVYDRDAFEELEAARFLRNRRARAEYDPSRSVHQTVMQKVLTGLPQTGSAVGAIRARWKEIVGERLAAHCTPLKFTKGKGGRVLVIEAPSAAAAILSHQAETIAERVKLGGGGNIAGIKVQQTKTKLAPQKRSSTAQPARRLSQIEREDIERSLEEIDSPVIREALRQLRTNMISRR